MFDIAKLTVKNVFKDRIAVVILSMIVLYFLVPVFSSFSMRQLQEVSITIAITLNSFILLILSIFGATATIWRDIERKHLYTILSYPIKREDYLLGRFIGFAAVMGIVLLINFILSVISIKIAASMYKSRLPIIWGNIVWAFVASYFEYVLLMAVGFLFSSFSTSFFMPLFATIGVFLAGNSAQGIYDYIFKSQTAHYSAFFKGIVKIIYYILPNFSVFDFTANAAYALKIHANDIITTSVYFAIYCGILLVLSNFIFSRRDLT